MSVSRAMAGAHCVGEWAKLDDADRATVFEFPYVVCLWFTAVGDSGGYRYHCSHHVTPRDANGRARSTVSNFNCEDTPFAGVHFVSVEKDSPLARLNVKP